MMKNHWTKTLNRLFLVILVGAATQAAAQITNVPGLSTEKPEILKKVEEKAFEYEPVDPEFWTDVTDAIKEGNFTKVVVMAASVIKDEKNSSSDESEEARLALGMGLARLNLSYGASTVFMDLAKSRNGTRIGEAALYELNLIGQKYYYEKEDIGDDLLVSNEFGPYHPDVLSFIGYHAGMFNLLNGLQDWANKEFEKVKVGSYWDYQLRYLKALGEIARNHFDVGIKALEELKADEKTPSDLKTKVTLQLARVKFETGDFNLAHDTYYHLDIPIREKGRVYLERAWSRFYMKDYSKALGLLAVANTPLYNSSASPERYILQMLIYRELCHYESVQTSAQEFRDRFEGAIKAIKARADLTKVPEIANLALLNEKLQYWANFITQLRNEKSELLDYDWKKFAFYEPMVKAYDLKDQQVQDRLSHEMEPRVRKIAETILDAEEQITYLDYTAKLDQLRIVRKGENRTYKSEKISYMTFDKIFWPIKNEHWSDELEDYQVLIRSRCGETKFETAPKEEEAAPGEEEFK